MRSIHLFVVLFLICTNQFLILDLGHRLFHSFPSGMFFKAMAQIVQLQQGRHQEFCASSWDVRSESVTQAQRDRKSSCPQRTSPGLRDKNPEYSQGSHSGGGGARGPN